MNSRDNLAYAYRAAGDLTRAVPCARPPSTTADGASATTTRYR
jgi:hypothetical protein